MFLIVLLVLFTMTMFLWLLSMLGAITTAVTFSGWLPFFACLILGTVVFLIGSGRTFKT